MNEKHKAIKLSVEHFYRQIKYSDRMLEQLRESCEHPKTEIIDYMWAPGHILSDTEICSICGKPLLPEYITKNE